MTSTSSSTPETPTLRIVGDFGPDPDAGRLEQAQARLDFAEALGRRRLRTEPGLFDSALVGRWPSAEHFVEDFITESGLAESMADLPMVHQPFITVDRVAVATYLSRELLVLPVLNSVWVFDARAAE